MFPRNTQNEDFIYNLIENGFEVDGAPARDTRYDGAQIYVENDVRTHIEDGKLLRMFGIVRDVEKHHRREETLRRERDEAFDILASLPQAVLALNEDCVVIAVSRAAERILNSAPDDLLGMHIDELGVPGLGSEIQNAIDSIMPKDGVSDRFAWSIAPRRLGGAVVTLEIVKQEALL